MANYLSVVIDQSANQWLLGLEEGSIDSWAELRSSFVKNFMASCQQPGTKYDLEKVRDYSGKPLREYIRRYLETRLSIPSISNKEAVSAFIKGLRYHDDFRNKLLRKRPTNIHDLLHVAKKWADAEDTDLQLKEDTRRLPRSDHAARCDDRRRNEHRDD
jgi:hypothetical protein